ncbi:MAG TPA: TolC family protein [Planctomycetota bacterium]|nr:TolC family protein [Planctomycetota bacterium]
MSFQSVLAVVSFVALSSCASLSPQESFGNVQSLVAERGISSVRWNQDTQADAEALQAIRDLLARDLTPDSAVQIALLGNARLQATFEELGVAQADLVQAGMLSNPVFYGEVRFPPHPRVSPLELDVVQSFLDVFLMPMRKRIAEAQLEGVKARVAGAVLDLAAEVRSRYYELQGAEQLLDMHRTIVEAQEASADAAQRLHAAGNVTDLDLAREQALLAEVEIDLARAEQQALEARESLTVSMGVATTEFAMTARLPDLPELDPEAGDLEDLALSGRLDLSAARANLQATAQSAGLTRYQALSEGTLGIHLEREPENTTTIGPSLELSIPIFDRGQAVRARFSAELRRGEREYAARVLEVRSEVRRARSQMLSARRTVERFRDVLLPLREQIVQDTLLRYNGMLVGVFELLQAKKEAVHAGTEYVRALQEYWTARTELEHAVGGRMPDGAQKPHDQEPKPAQPNPAEDEHEGHQHGGKS